MEKWRMMILQVRVAQSVRAWHFHPPTFYAGVA